MKTKRKGRALSPAGRAEACEKACAVARRYVQDLLDGRVPARRRGALLRHLDDCRGCFSHYEFTRLMRLLVRRRVLGELCPRALSHRVRRAVRRGC